MDEPTALKVVNGKLAKIEALNGDLRALIHVDPVHARDQAACLDSSKLDQGPLFGTTFVAKDLIDVAHQPTQAGSKLFGNQCANQDADCLSKLKAAGAVVLGKANMHELAVGGAINPWFGQVINPLSSSHGTGGTSSGSAAAVAAGFCDFSLGTDSGGSNRSVAAASGVYGYKPTNGLLSAAGVLPTAPTMDTVGVIAPSATLISRCLSVLVDDEMPPKDECLEGRTFARITNLISSPIDSVVSEALGLVFNAIVTRGGHVVELDLHAPEALAAAGVAILRYEFAQMYGEKIDGSADSVGLAVHSFLDASRQISISQYQDAMALRLEHQAKWSVLLAHIDGFISPTAPGLAPDLSNETTAVGATRVPYGAAGAEFRMWANTIGIPVVAIPVLRARGLPASVQLAGAMHSDKHLLNLATALGGAITEKIAV